MAKSEFSPLSEIKSPYIHFDATIPYVPKESIGINERRIAALMRFGAVSSLRVIGEIGQQTSRVIPIISGIDTHGTATAVGARVEQVATSIPERQSDGDSHSILDRWVAGTIRLNMDEIAQRLQTDERNKKGVRSSAGWAKHLNKAIQEGIIHIGTTNLLPQDPTEVLTTGFVDGSFTFNGMGTANFPDFIASLLHQPNLPTGLAVIANVLLWNALSNAGATFLLNTHRKHTHQDTERKTHYSLLFGAQLDRAILLALGTKTSKLVRELPKRRDNKEQ